MTRPRLNALKHQSRAKVTKKTLSEFVDSFEKLMRILQQRYETRCGDQISVFSPPIVGSDGDCVIGSLPKTPFSFSETEINNQPKKDHIPQKRFMGTQPFQVSEDVKKLMYVVESGACKYIPVSELTDVYNQIEIYHLNVIEHFASMRDTPEKELLSREHAISLNKIASIKRIIRNQMRSHFLTMVTPVSKNMIKYTPQHTERIVKSADFAHVLESVDPIRLNSVIESFMPLFTPCEIRNLFIDFLSHRKKKVGEIFKTTRLSLYVIESLIEREVLTIERWFGKIIFQDFHHDVKKPIESTDSTNKDPSIDFFRLNKQIPRETYIFRCYIYSLVKDSYSSFRDSDVLTFLNGRKEEISEMMQALSISESKTKLIAKVLCEDILREMRQKSLEADDVLEL